MALEHSKCMREHGVEDFPDPNFDGDGGAQVRIGGRQGHQPGVAEVQGGREGVPRTMPGGRRDGRRGER